ncbi:MAG: DUF6359 domain-containing protein [Paraprevotella sp.]|nr:DUF6359 domain-containing protein [Paraprevotella sp.]
MKRTKICQTVLVAALCCIALSCQKVELPSEDGEDTTQPGQASTTPGGTEDADPLPPEYVETYTVADIQEQYAGEELDFDYEVGVVGYIVESCTGNTISSALFSADGASRSNILIADSKGETDVDRCLPVELKSGSDVRDGLNLADHPENIGQRVYLYSLVKKYFRVVGLRSTLYYRWVAGGEDEPEQPETPEEPDPLPQPDPDPDPLPQPNRTDTIPIGQNPSVVPGGRSV